MIPSAGRARALALALATAGAAGACVASEWRDASDRLHAAVAAARAAGYEPLAGPHNDFGVFRAAGTARAGVPLTAGGDYVIAAACTAGCDTLDLEVLGPDGAVAARDTTAAPAPVLVFRPAADGPHTLVLRHGACARDRCRWVAQVYRRR